MEVTSEVGKVQVQLLVTEAIRPDCVYMTPAMAISRRADAQPMRLGASDSDLHVTYTDPISGGQALSQTFVTVKKA